MDESGDVPDTARFKERRKPAAMVGWYEPGQLAKTAVDVLLSTIFGRHADHRLLEALEVGDDTLHDYTRNEEGLLRDEIWIDYVADVADGWDSTYAVACWLAQPSLALRQADGREVETERGKLLVFGGDEVYPVASRDGYQRRLIAPYETALGWTNPPHPHAFAVAGNHDWYDSLVAFTRLFCSQRWFGGWRTRQTRSYFALKLPHGWWLLGTDVQLDSDIDSPQVQYFQRVAAAMGPEDRVILCNAEPHWIYAAIYGKRDADYNENNLAFLEKKILHGRVRVFLAGDLHHYRRHEACDGAQKITAGGGGAFLHPTHGPKVANLKGKDEKGHPRRVFTLQKSFPDDKTSRRLALRNLLFPWLNPWFGLLTAGFYLMTSWVVMAEIGTLGISEFPKAVHTTLETMANSPAATLWAVAIFAAFLLFTDTHVPGYRRIAGPLHGLAHLTATFFIGWGASYLAVTGLCLPFKSFGQLAVSTAVILVGGYVIGSEIMGIYLLVSLNGFRRHSNEAFSALHIPDWKSFLRLRIDGHGTLSIFPIGIRRVPRKWKEALGPSWPRLVPDDPAASPPELIEDPIVVRDPPAAQIADLLEG